LKEFLAECGGGVHLGLVLKEWSMSFDPLLDPLAPSKVWVIQPNLPLIFWNEDVLKNIAKKNVKFCSFQPEWDTKLDRRWVWL
jgi:hypothetical protein